MGRARRGVAILCFSLAALGWPISEQSFAANVYLHKGEGGAGIDAELQLGMYVGGDKLPPDLEWIGDRKDEEPVPVHQ
jgi:hypothetical protein